MGLGKTVELLALVTANPYTGPPPDFSTKQDAKPQHERVDCPCGAYSDRPEEEEGSYDGLWLQCETCLAWQHGACVGHPRRAPQGDYICGPCLRAQAQTEVSQPCGTTLIVCPAPILQQWWEEIHRHIHPGALQVVIYEGQPQPTSGHKRPKIVTAADLAVADIALTTYDVLRKDLNHEPNEPGFYSDRIMRRQKKYQVIPTPLTRLRFWRVAIDEAQMVESSTAKAAAMALLLETEHRWCVTGTPLSRGLEDLQGLMAFLKVDPYSERHWWQRCIQRPYEAGSRAARARLLTLLKPSAGGLLWRSAKADVKEELGLPPQHSHLTHLTFSAIERHFYSRQHQDCVGTARAAISASTLAAAQAAASEVLDLNSSSPRHASAFEDRPLTQREEQKVLHPLVKLRQACVHPQVGAGGIRSLSQSRAPMTMREVLDVLLSKARVEAEDAQRVLLASLNGLAGLLLLQGHVAEAVRAYREVLGMVEANAALVRADKLQQLHTLHNLGLVLEGPAKGLPDVPRTLRDSTLAERAAVLREEYLAEPVAKLAAAEAELREAQAGGDKIRSDLHRELGRDSESECSFPVASAVVRGCV